MSTLFAAAALSLSQGVFYFDVSAVAADVERYAMVREQTVIRGPGVTETQYSDQFQYLRGGVQTYGRIALGFSVPFYRDRCAAYSEVWHMSLPGTSRDRGTNAGALGVRCSVPVSGWR